MKYFLLIIISLIILSIFLGLFFIFTLTYGFYDGCQKQLTPLVEKWQNFQPLFWTNVKKHSTIHHSYGNPDYHRHNLHQGKIPIDQNTVTIGISVRNKNTLHRYILNHLIKKIILYQSKQFKVIDIDYQNDYQVLLDLNNYKINYGLISTPVLYDYLVVRNQRNKTNLEFLTTISYNFVYGITLDNRKIHTLYDLKGAKIGMSKNLATERLVLRDFLDNIKGDIEGHQIVECKHEYLLKNLFDGVIDFFIIIGEFPSDIIRNLITKYRNVRLVDIYMKNHSEFVSKYPYQGARLNSRILDYYPGGVFSHFNRHKYHPLHTEYSSLTEYHPHIITYKFQNSLLSNNANRMVNNYELIRHIFRTLTNNRRIGLGYLPENYLQRHVAPGVISPNFPIPMQPEVQDFHHRITYNPEWI